MTIKPGCVEDLARVVLSRNPSVSSKLHAGLSESRIKRVLDRAKVSGEIAPLIAFYRWRNGTDLSLASNVESRQALEGEKAKMSFFPCMYYYFPSLEMATAHFDTIKEVAKNYPNISDAVGRYFPLFWNGSTEWLAVDLKPSNRNRMMIVNHKSDPAIRIAYSSFDEFVADAVRANEENRPLRCFGELGAGRCEHDL